mgnify:CR=1 FL=1
MPAVYMAGNRFSFLYKRQTWKGLSYSQRLFLLQVHFDHCLIQMFRKRTEQKNAMNMVIFIYFVNCCKKFFL